MDALAPLPASWRLWYTDNSFEDGKAKDKYHDLGIFSDVQSFWKYCKLTTSNTELLGLNCGLSLMRDGESPRWQDQKHRPGRVAVRVDARRRGINSVNELVEEMFMLVVGGTMDDELIGASITSKNMTYVLHLWHEGNTESHVLVDRVREMAAALKIVGNVDYHPLY